MPAFQTSYSFVSVDKIPKCDDSNESSLVDVVFGTEYCSFVRILSNEFGKLFLLCVFLLKRLILRSQKDKPNL